MDLYKETFRKTPKQLLDQAQGLVQAWDDRFTYARAVELLNALLQCDDRAPDQETLAFLDHYFI